MNEMFHSRLLKDNVGSGGDNFWRVVQIPHNKVVNRCQASWLVSMLASYAANVGKRLAPRLILARDQDTEHNRLFRQ